jgi:DNA-binding protein H-NS
MTSTARKVSQMGINEVAAVSQALAKALQKQQRNLARALDLVGRTGLEFDFGSINGRGSGRRVRRLQRNYKNVTYVNPDNKDQKWVGRGRRPGWVNQAIKKHKIGLEDMAA